MSISNDPLIISEPPILLNKIILFKDCLKEKLRPITQNNSQNYEIAVILLAQFVPDNAFYLSNSGSGCICGNTAEERCRGRRDLRGRLDLGPHRETFSAAQPRSGRGKRIPDITSGYLL